MELIFSIVSSVLISIFVWVSLGALYLGAIYIATQAFNVLFKFIEKKSSELSDKSFAIFLLVIALIAGWLYAIIFTDAPYGLVIIK